ncbi:MAG: molybdopterin molybdotransferase MoeA [Limnobacter sp.]|nr:molybdopterin molybdotransferase MoeA [Limnobacter sp.]
MIALNTLLQTVWQAAQDSVVGSESLALQNAMGCVLAQPVVAARNVPAFNNSAMDGYAVRSADFQGTEGLADACAASWANHHTNGAVPVVGRIVAGASPEALPPLQPGTCARIFTGAPLPPGADAVVMQEQAQQLAPGDTPASDVRSVRFLSNPQPGEWVRRQGEDIATGDMVLPAGIRLNPFHSGLLASLGMGTVRVHRRLKVGLLATGSELQNAGQTPCQWADIQFQRVCAPGLF